LNLALFRASFVSILRFALLIPALKAQAQTIEYIHTDALGSPIAVTDSNRNVIERSEYAPYGDLLNRPDTDGPGFAGHVLDAATGFSYMQQRYYDPLIGRFLSVDPVTANSSTGENFNRYWYANNNPYRFSDPDGRCPICAAVPIVLGGIGGGVVDYGVQRYMNPDKPVNKLEVGLAVATGAVTGGTGGLAVAAVGRGMVTVGQAIAIQAAVGGATNMAATAGQNAIEGQPTSGAQLAISGVGGVAGSLGGSAVGAIAGDFSQAASQGAIQRMASAPISSPSGIGFHIAVATVEVGPVGTKQGAVQGAASVAGQNAAQALVTEQQKVVEKNSR
jgi:RHS repeat-associated protein